MSSGRNWGLEVDPDIYKKMAKMPKVEAERVLKVIESLAFNPYYGDIAKIKGRKTFGAEGLVPTESFTSCIHRKSL